MAQKKSREINEDLPETSPVEEYKVLNLSVKKLPQGTTIQSLQQWEQLKISRFYVNSLGGRDVFVGYTFVAPGFLAAGSCRVDREDYIIGESVIRETQKDKEVKLRLGTTSRILIKTDVSRSGSNNSKMMSSYNGEVREEDITINSQIDNLTSDLATLRLEYMIGTAALSKMNSDFSPNREDGLLIFSSSVKPGKSTFKAVFHLQY
jgi:hypothetical protein